MDNAKRQHQRSMTVEEQIKNLRSLGLIINDEKYAEKILNDISYFRLIKAYSLDLKPRNGKYYSGVTFEQIVDLYLFNANLRQILFSEIERAEINLRCRVANYFAEKYGVLGYLDKNNFNNSVYFAVFIRDIKEETRRNSKSPFVKNFQQNYEGGSLPIYALAEILSFGTLSKFYKNMLNCDKKAIASTFNVGYTYLESWFESLSYVRNICAHYGRLYNARLSKIPKLYKEYSKAGISNDRLFGVLLCLKHILNNEHWGYFVIELEALFEKYENINISTMGFTKDWKNLLLN